MMTFSFIFTIIMVLACTRCCESVAQDEHKKKFSLQVEYYKNKKGKPKKKDSGTT